MYNVPRETDKVAASRWALYSVCKPISAGSVLALLLFVPFAVWFVYQQGVADVKILDDFTSLHVLQGIESGSKSFLDVVRGDVSGPLGRPVSMLTFALEGGAYGDSIAAVKRNSILLHSINGLLVFWFVYLLFKSVNLAHSKSAALIAMFLWSFAPLHVSTVLYAVQRMALLSALFTLSALIAYIKLRSSLVRKSASYSAAIFLLLFTTLAPLAKENGVLVIPLIIVMEAFWFRQAEKKMPSQLSVSDLAAMLLLLGLFSLAIYFAIGMEDLKNSYVHRGYTVQERLASQVYALGSYIKQFFLPDIASMGVYHDDFYVPDLSVGDRRWQIPALLLPFAFLSVLALVHKKYLCLFYVVFSFLCAHSLESSLLALEIYFEHRNYLPSVFLSLGFARALAMVRRSHVQQWLLVFSVIAYVSYLGFSTFRLAGVWSSKQRLAYHHLLGHPYSARANSDAAVVFAEHGNYADSVEFSERVNLLRASNDSARREAPGDFFIRNFALACIAGEPFSEQDLAMLIQLRSSRPISNHAGLRVIVDLRQKAVCQSNAWAELAHALNIMYLDRSAGGPKPVYKFLAQLMYELSMLDPALEYLERAQSIDEDDSVVGLMLVQVLLELGDRAAARKKITELRLKAEDGKLTDEQAKILNLYGEIEYVL